MPDRIVLGAPRRRKYFDAVGRPLRVGDIIHYPTARSSSVHVNYGRIAEIKDLSTPAYLGYADGQRVESWDRAFELKVEHLEFDSVEFRFKEPKVWDPVISDYRPRRPGDPKKMHTIKRVDRVIRLEHNAEPEFGRHDDGSPRASRNAWKPDDRYDPLG